MEGKQGFRTRHHSPLQGQDCVLPATGSLPGCWTSNFIINWCKSWGKDFSVNSLSWALLELKVRADVEGRSFSEGLLFLSGIWAGGDSGHHAMRHGPALLLPACSLLSLIYQSNYTHYISPVRFYPPKCYSSALNMWGEWIIGGKN